MRTGLPSASVRCALTVLAMATLSCGEKEFKERGLVDSPRVLAIVADPPEVRPGERTSIHAVTGGITGEVTWRWSVCTKPEASSTFTAQSTFGQATPDQGCFGDASVGVIALPFDGPDVLLPIPADLLQRLEALQSVYGRSLSPEVLRRIVQTAGLPLTVALQLEQNGTVLVRAIKRVVVIDREARNTNPPRPSFRVGVSPEGGVRGIPVAAVEGSTDPEICARDNGAPVVARTGQRVEIAPDEPEDPWLQEYIALNSNGGLSTLRETAFYAWFATAGEFTSARTRAPTRNTIWIAPEREGLVTHWLVARDGRGGASVCRYQILVEARDR